LLNELSALSHSLTARGIQIQAWHPWIQTFKKGEAIVAELNESGDLARVSLLSADEVAGLRNIAPDFHNSFPGPAHIHDALRLREKPGKDFG
jgi:hypothetical protein